MMRKPLSEIAKNMKCLIPARIPDTYRIKPDFLKIADDESVRNGIAAYRDFLYKICDRLADSGEIYDKPPKNAKTDHPSLQVDYPFLHNLNMVLYNIGCYGQLADDDTALLLNTPQSLAATMRPDGRALSGKIAAPNVFEVLRFLAECGMSFAGIDLTNGKPNLVGIVSVIVTYPDNPAMLTGLRVMAVAQRDFGVLGNHNIFFRCDYRTLKDEDTDVSDVLNDIISPLPDNVRDFVLRLHAHNYGLKLKCKPYVFNFDVKFIYQRGGRDVCTISVSPDYGYNLLIKPKNTEKYKDVIETFPAYLQGKIAEGYGCDRKRFGTPCNRSCQGIVIPIDDKALELGKHIELWLEKEVS